MSELMDKPKERVRVLKTLIQRLHEGTAPEEVRKALKTLARETDHTEIMAMEQELIAEGMPSGEIQRLCYLHSQVTRELGVAPPARSLAPGHPIDTFRRGNQALRTVLARIRQTAKTATEMSHSTNADSSVEKWRHWISDVSEIEKHSQRKEHLFALMSGKRRRHRSFPGDVGQRR